jgi:hypothetical protein
VAPNITINQVADESKITKPKQEGNEILQMESNI